MNSQKSKQNQISRFALENVRQSVECKLCKCGEVEPMEASSRIESTRAHSQPNHTLALLDPALLRTTLTD